MLDSAIYDFIDLFPELPSLPDMEVYQQFIIELIQSVSYFFPIHHFIIQMLLILAVTHFTFIAKAVVKIWEMLPFT